jgi:hypothetical protein
MVKLKEWNDRLKPSHLKTRNQAIKELKEGKEVKLKKEEVQELQGLGVVFDKKAKKPKK